MILPSNPPSFLCDLFVAAIMARVFPNDVYLLWVDLAAEEEVVARRVLVTTTQQTGGGACFVSATGAYLMAMVYFPPDVDLFQVAGCCWWNVGGDWWRLVAIGGDWWLLVAIGGGGQHASGQKGILFARLVCALHVVVITPNTGHPFYDLFFTLSPLGLLLPDFLACRLISETTRWLPAWTTLPWTLTWPRFPYASFFDFSVSRCLCCGSQRSSGTHQCGPRVNRVSTPVDAHSFSWPVCG